MIKWFGFSESWVLFFFFLALAVTINVASLRRYSNYIGYAFSCTCVSTFLAGKWGRLDKVCHFDSLLVSPGMSLKGTLSGLS